MVGASMIVVTRLKPGLDEKLFEKALVIELRNRGHNVTQQKRFPVHYEHHLVGTLIPDLIIDDIMIADAKVVSAFNDTHVAQMVGDLNNTSLELAIFLNFKHSKLQWKRIVK